MQCRSCGRDTNSGFIEEGKDDSGKYVMMLTCMECSVKLGEKRREVEANKK